MVPNISQIPARIRKSPSAGCLTINFSFYILKTNSAR